MEYNRKSYTLEQLKLADDLAFPSNMKESFDKHEPDELGFSYYYDFIHRHERSLMKQVFTYSRADFDSGMGAMFEAIIDDLLEGTQKAAQ